MTFPILRPTWPLNGEEHHRTFTSAGNPITTDGLSPHDRSRGLLAARGLIEFSNAEAFIWCDDDTDYTEEHIRQLEQAYAELPDNVATLTGVYVCRHSAERGQTVLNFNPAFTERKLTLRFAEDGGLFPITAHGFGFCITSRSVLERMQAPTAIYTSMMNSARYEGKGWFLPTIVGKQHLGEDRSFCQRILEQDLGRMFVDTRIVVPHAGYTLVPPGVAGRA